MISEQTIEIVKSTAPVLAKEGEAITKLFYQNLFTDYPALKNIFNMANQAKGEQSRALADSVFQYAVHIDKLEALGDAVNRIAQKHASLQVAPEHYPIVGEYLLSAIKVHLSLEENDPILSAWAEAYDALAAIFVSTEEQIYKANEDKDGGWRGDRAFVVHKIKDEGGDVLSLYLKSKDGLPIATFEAGQYVGVKVSPESSEFTEIRQYSLSNAPNSDYYRITVRTERHPGKPGGIVSHYLQEIAAGDTILLQAPTGEFTIKDQNNEFVLLGGGVGIAPLISMLLAKTDQGVDLSKVTMIQCCRDNNHHIMADELIALQAKHGFNYYVSYEKGTGTDIEGYLNADTLDQWLTNKQADVYFCGPRPFMMGIHDTLQEIGFKEENLHYETFGPSIGLNS